MKLRAFERGDLLYHGVHGLCRVDEITKQVEAGRTALYYSLVPKTVNRMKVRFVVPAAEIKISGFHTPITSREADKILNYLKVGRIQKTSPAKLESDSAGQDQVWVTANQILSLARGNSEAKDHRRHQTFENSAKGLVGELALVYKIALKEAAEKVIKNLGHISKINPVVLAILARASED